MSWRIPLITTFGLGYMRPASGTWGSLPTVLVAGGLIQLGHSPTADPILYHAVLIGILVVFSLACIVGGAEAEARFGKKDPGQAVADETAAQAIPLLALPASATSDLNHTAITLAIAFVAFRVFDIIKPPPARQIQRVGGGWGILLDDLFAGVYAAVIVQVVTRTLF